MIWLCCCCCWCRPANHYTCSDSWPRCQGIQRHAALPCQRKPTSTVRMVSGKRYSGLVSLLAEICIFMECNLIAMTIHIQWYILIWSSSVMWSLETRNKYKYEKSQRNLGRGRDACIRYIAPYILPKIRPFPWGNLDSHLINRSLGQPTHYPKRHLDRVSRFSTIHIRYRRTDRQRDRTTTNVHDIDNNNMKIYWWWSIA